MFCARALAGKVRNPPRFLHERPFARVSQVRKAAGRPLPLAFRRQGRASFWRISTQKTGQTRQSGFARVSQVHKAAGRPVPLAFRRRGRASFWRISTQKRRQTRQSGFARVSQVRKAAGRPLPLAFRGQGRASFWQVCMHKTRPTVQSDLAPCHELCKTAGRTLATPKSLPSLNMSVRPRGPSPRCGRHRWYTGAQPVSLRRCRLWPPSPARSRAPRR
jgi:hypothetical protein